MINAVLINLKDHRSSAQKVGIANPDQRKNVLAQLGLADVKAFGLEYQDCEVIMQKMGYTLEVKALSVA